MKFYLPIGVGPFSSMDSTFGSAFGGGSNLAIGVYSEAGSLLWSENSYHVPNGTNQATSVSISPLTLAAGNYYMAWTADDTSGGSWGIPATSLLQMSYHNGGSDGNVINQSTIHFGTAANSATAGPVMPATLGTLSAPGSYTYNIPLVLFH